MGCLVGSHGVFGWKPCLVLGYGAKLVTRVWSIFGSEFPHLSNENDLDAWQAVPLMKPSHSRMHARINTPILRTPRLD